MNTAEAISDAIVINDEYLTKEFGKGRYSAEMKRVFYNSRNLLGMRDNHALKVAKAFGADLGRIQGSSEVSIGKPGKDGTTSLKDVMKIKGLKMTPAISIAKIGMEISDLRQWGLDTVENVKFNGIIEEWLADKE